MVLDALCNTFGQSISHWFYLTCYNTEWFSVVSIHELPYCPSSFAVLWEYLAGFSSFSLYCKMIVLYDVVPGCKRSLGPPYFAVSQWIAFTGTVSLAYCLYDSPWSLSHQTEGFWICPFLQWLPEFSWLNGLCHVQSLPLWSSVGPCVPHVGNSSLY